MVRSGETVMEKVRRYRAIASLHRQTASFRPLQRWSLLDQAEEWDRLAVAELEAYFNACSSHHDDRRPQAAVYAEPRWVMPAGRETDEQYIYAPKRWPSATALAA
jgi:hypothetical protein